MLQATTLDWALKHVEVYGDTDIFPVPFEFQAIRDAWDKSATNKSLGGLKTYLSQVDLTNWDCRPMRRCLSPKHRFGFRVSTQLDPLDTLLYLAVVYEIGPDIEAARVPVGENVVFSYRFNPDPSGGLFDPNFSYQEFQERTSERLDRNGVTHVVVADIADFYPRLYSHPLENALKVCTKKSAHVTAIQRMLGQCNFKHSYGLPVGPAPSRLLAELAIEDVDKALQSEQYDFCRYSDDYRIFCPSEREAFQALAFLANTLFENHGLTLQQHKTEIIPTDQFRSSYLKVNSPTGGEPLSNRFRKVAERLGWELYDAIDYQTLDSTSQKEIDALDLHNVLGEQLAGETLDIPLTRSVLNVLTQVRDDKSVRAVVDGLPKLYTVVRDALEYTQSFTGEPAARASIGQALLSALDESLIGHLEYHRCWVLSTFTSDRQWDNEDRFVALYNRFTDTFSQRELTLALGRAGQDQWFKTRKRSFDDLSDWVKRAFIAAASCLPGDEHKFWCDSIERRLDPLEAAVARWSRQNKFR